MSDDDDLAEITAALSRAEDFSPQELTALRKGWLALTEAGAAHFKTPTDHDQGFARGGAAQADDGALTEEELAQVTRAWHGLIEHHAHGGKMHYTMPDVRGMPAPGSFRIPRDVFEALGDGDLKVGGAVVHSMFGVEDDPEDPTVISPLAIRLVGNGSLAAGTKILTRFVQMIRRQSRDYVIEQPDGNHGRVVRRAAR